MESVNFLTFFQIELFLKLILALSICLTSYLSDYYLKFFFHSKKMKPNWPTNFSSQILNTRCVHFFLQNFVTSSLLSNCPSLWFFSGKTECLLYFVHWVTWSLNKVFVWVTFEFRTFFFHFHFSLSLSLCIYLSKMVTYVFSFITRINATLKQLLR